MKKILIIEDDQTVANSLGNKLILEGFKVDIAYDGEKGLERVQAFEPDAILLDLVLPKLSGVDLLKKVRANPAFQQVPIVVFSNTYLTNMIQDAWKAGATKCLSKSSCTPRHVIDIMRNTVAGNGARAGVAPTATTTPAAPSSSSDAAFEADLRKSFVESLPATLITLRALLQTLIKAENESIRVRQIQELYRRIHALTGNAGITGMTYIAQMSDALEALLKELYDKPKNINASTLRTVALSIDFLGNLFGKKAARLQDMPQANVLVVDDEAISRRAIVYALEKAKLRSVAAEDPLEALKLVEAKKFDLVFLDVDMPNMNGYELCARLRTMPSYAKTPVIFVSNLSDFESRTQSMMSGGNDLIGKPFLFIELAVKALVHVLRGRLGE